MKRIILFFLIFSVISCGSNSIKKTEAQLGLIPKPVKTIVNDGEFLINKKTVVVATGKAKEEAEKFVTLVSQAMGFKLQLTDKEVSKNRILFEISDTLNSVGKEGYKLDVTKKGITVKALKPTGLFYGVQTIRQLLPKEIYSNQLQNGISWSLPCVSIMDTPRFGWRGFMLDVSRNFFDTDHIKRLLDRMAIHKLNRFHWHLTDDEGWRIEIKSYPKLTEIGAWRGKNEALKPSRGSGDERYGGFYTQEEIKDIVKYAAERHIQIMPEIDVPGHAKAILVAYPELKPDVLVSTKSVQGISNNVLSPVKEETYKMLDGIIGEISSLFPFEYIHIGGDEVNTTVWTNSAACIKFMKQNNFKTGYELQNFFIKKMETLIKSHGKKMIGWNEILHGGLLEKETAVMSWTGTGPGYESAKKGHKVIFTPGQYTYFDMKSTKDDEFGHWWAGLVPIEKVYSFNPLDKEGLSKEQLDNILGVQACLWSEYLFKEGRAQYQTWPRLCALAEVGWTPQEERDFTNFYDRLGSVHFDRLDQLNVGYRVPQPKAFFKNDSISIISPYKSAQVRYTTNASEPTIDSKLYNGEPFYIEDYLNLRMKLYSNGGKASRTVSDVEIHREVAANWTPKYCSTKYQKINFDIKGIDASSFWYLDFVYKKGANRIDIRSVKLLENGKVISSDIHNGFAGGALVNNRYRLYVKSFNEKATYSIEVDMKSDGGTDSYGIIAIAKSEFKEPTVKVETTVSNHKDFGVKNLTDWNRKTYFKSLEKGKKGDTFIFQLSESITTQNLEVLSGHPNKNENILTDASVFTSENGKDYSKVNDFKYGASKNKFENLRIIKSVKVVLNTNHESQIIIQDLKIK